MDSQHLADLRKIRNVVNNYFNFHLEDKILDSPHVMARLIYLKLVMEFYKDGKDKPKHYDILAMMGLSDSRGVPKMLREFDTYPNILYHYNILKTYIGRGSKFSQEEIKQLLLNNKLTLTDIIDAVIDLNGLTGVGLISFGQGLNDYCRSKIILRDEI